MNRGGGLVFICKLSEHAELRPLELRHCGEIFQLIDRNRKFLRTRLPWVDEVKTLEDIKEFRQKMLRQSANDGTIIAGVWYEGVFAGIVEFSRAAGTKCWELGYWLGEEYQGKGLVTMSCRSFIDNAFNNQEANRIEIRVEPDNIRSRAVAERLGFTLEGTLRQKGINSDGHLVDLVMFSLLRSEWG